jgi:N-dimethylarginine dimethylaminohydrolase
VKIRRNYEPSLSAPSLTAGKRMLLLLSIIILSAILQNCQNKPTADKPVQKTGKLAANLPAPEPPKKQRRDILGDYSGQAEHILMHFADYDIIPTLYGLLRNLDSDKKITIVSPDSTRTKLLEMLIEQWKIQNPQRLQILTENSDLTFWIRDDFVVTHDSRILLPKRYTSNGTPRSITRVAKELGFKIIPTDLGFDGGNITATEKYVFVGFDTILGNINTQFKTPKMVKKYIEKLFGKKVVVVGSAAAPQPHEHIDMFLTPVGDNKVIIGSPKIGAQLLAKAKNALASNYGKVYFNEQLTPIPAEAKKILFNTPDFVERLQSELSLDYRDANLNDDATLATLLVKNSLPSLQKSFDAIEADLKSKGIEIVLKLPILVNTGITDGPFISYNNMLIENSGATKRAYLPTYNIKALDEAATSRLKTLGFSVIPIDVQNISFYNGTLRCSTQIMKRRS